MRVLVVTDSSPYSDATLHVVGQVSQRLQTDGGPVLLAVIREQTERSRADGLLAHARQVLGLREEQSIIRMGQPVKEAVRESREGSYDLVVVGESQGRRPPHRLLESPLALRVAELAPCPVLIVKGRVGPIHRLLLCDSGADSLSASAKVATPVLGRFVDRMTDMLRGDEEITVLHVMSQISAGPGVRGRQLRADAEELIAERAPEGQLFERDVQTLVRPGMPPRLKVRHGLVIDEILGEARAGDYDLVVIGAHPATGWQHVLLDDLARQIILQLDRSVLLVR